jgi:flagellar hook protein FlgE
MSFQQGLSGLNAASKNLEAIGNNVANANTVGFKASQVQFADVYASSLSGGGTGNIGIGVKVAQVAQQFSQGNITGSNNPLDIAINGDGFFRMNDNGIVTFARNGQFQLDKGGYIINANGSRLTGFAADANGSIMQGEVVDVQISRATINPRQTAEVDTALNLDSRLPAIATPFNAADPTTYSSASPVTIYDSQGMSHIVQSYYVKTGPNSWDVYASSDGTAIGAVAAAPATNAGPTVNLGAPTAFTAIPAGSFSINGISIGAVAAGGDAATQAANLAQAINDANVPNVSAAVVAGAVQITASPSQDMVISMNGAGTNTATATANQTALLAQTGFTSAQMGTQAVTATRMGQLNFRTDGTLNTATSSVPLTIPLTFSSGVTSPFSITVNVSGTTQFGSNFNVNTLLQDGYAAGELSGFNVGADGIITGRYTNGKSAVLGQVVLSTFSNPNGLQPLGNNVWAETSASGQPLAAIPGSGSLGVLQSSAVEDSNVDLTAELVNMITAQRVYQANAQTIKTQDQLLQTLVNLR